MAQFDHLLQSYEVRDLLDDIASADPPAYLRRCFAEGVSSPVLSFARVQQLAVCAMVLDALVNVREYACLEAELIADWRVHYLKSCEALRDPCVAALQRARQQLAAADAESSDELAELEHRVAGA